MCSSIGSWARERQVSGSARRGLSIILVVIMLVVLIAFVSLAIDIGRLRLARAELQTVADAAARNGAYSFPPSTSSEFVINATLEAALKNEVIDNDDQQNSRTNPGMELEADEDIHFGTWDPIEKKFTEIFDQPNTDQDERRHANAVRAYARRWQERDNPIKLIFAPVVGTFTKDIETTATAYITGESSDKFGFVGIDGVYANGNPGKLYGSVISDGNIDLGNADVQGITVDGKYYAGDARPGTDAKIIQGPNSVVDGWTANLSYSLKTPVEKYPAITQDDVDKIVPKVQDFPANMQFAGGSNLANNLKYQGMWTNGPNVTVTIKNGYIRLYINDVDGGQGANKGELDLTQFATVWQNSSIPSASRLEFYIVGNKIKKVMVAGNRQGFYHVYAPQCDVEIVGTADWNGWAIGKTLTWKGTASYSYDGTLSNQPTSPVTIHLVE
jgi:hypothetical protein